ncbi:MAG: carbohydrate kinase family protein [Anaerolineae bacterium]|nr:carbohydrate kinase family protein [Anaerolineae bacterium]
MEKRILVVGEVNADLILAGLPSLPILGRELVGDAFHMVLGGSSAITAARLAALGAPVDFFGAVGDDDFGRFVTRELASFGVETGFIRTLDTPTGVTIALTYSHDRALLTYPGTIASFDGAGLTPEFLARYQHVHVGSFFLQTALQPRLPQLLAMAQEQGATTSLDVGWDPIEQWGENALLRPTLAKTDYFFPNEEEVQALSAGNDRLTALAQQVHGLLIVKQGARGATAYDGRGERGSAAAFPVDVVDTTGAGDAFNAGFLYAACVEKATVEDALRFAAACGAQAVTQIGGATGAPRAALIREQFGFTQENQS